MKKLIAFLGIMILIVGTAGLASANTVASSTMYFGGTGLTDQGGGVYTGTIDAVAGTYYIPEGPGTTYNSGTLQWENPDETPAVGGWDVYAKQGGTAYYDDAVQGTIGADHDAYSNVGGWGQFYTPDIQDWNNYQLTLTAGNWYLEYKGVNKGTPMSGTMNWTTLFAAETDVGSYRGTVPADPDANDGGALANGGGAGAWDMDWTWGSEVIPLQYSGFNLIVTDLGGGVFSASLTPTPIPGAVWLFGSGLIGLVGIRRKLRN